MANMLILYLFVLFIVLFYSQASVQVQTIIVFLKSLIKTIIIVCKVALELWFTIRLVPMGAMALAEVCVLHQWRSVKNSTNVGCSIQPHITHFRFCKIIQRRTDILEVTYEDKSLIHFPSMKKMICDSHFNSSLHSNTSEVVWKAISTVHLQWVCDRLFGNHFTSNWRYQKYLHQLQVSFK